MWDQLQRFVFDNCEMRGVLVRLDASIARNLQSQLYPEVIREFLAHAMLAVSMLTTTIKIKGRISLQLKGQGDLSMLLAECNDEYGLRGIAKINTMTPSAGYATLTQGGLLALSILPDVGSQYQGIVPLQGSTLAESLEHYFQQSEQLTTNMHLVWDGQQAAGLMVQALPGATSEDIQRIVALTQTITPAELLGLPAETLLHRLYHEEQLRLFASQAVHFECRCSREKMRNSLRLLQVDELHEMLREQNTIRVNCEFCNTEHCFDAIDIANLHNDLPGSVQSH